PTFRKPGRPLLDHEEADAPMLRFYLRVRLHNDEEQISVHTVCNERLLSIHDIIIAVFYGGCPDVGEIRTSSGLRHCDACNEIGGDASRQPTLLLFVRPVRFDVRNDDVIMQADPRQSRSDPFHLLPDDDAIAEIEAETAVLFFDLRTKEPHFPKLPPKIYRNEPILR